MHKFIVKTMDILVIITIILSLLIGLEIAGIVGVIVALFASIVMSCFWFGISLICREMEENNKTLKEISDKLSRIT